MVARALALLILAAAAGAAAMLAVSDGEAPSRARPVARAPAARPVRTSPPRTASIRAPYVIRHVLDTGGPIGFGKWFWDERGAPAAGPVLVTVDLGAQVLSIFRGGYEIGTAAVLFGADHKPTPLGVFPVTEKNATHVSNLYGAPMPYMLRLTNDGVSIHGSKVEWGYATHGCVGVPIPFARKLFAAVKLGDRVVITRGEHLSVGGAATALR